MHNDGVFQTKVSRLKIGVLILDSYWAVNITILLRPCSTADTLLLLCFAVQCGISESGQLYENEII